MKNKGNEKLITRMARENPGILPEKLKAKIIAGVVQVDGEGIRDPNYKISSDAVLTEKKKRYVSRGGIKLEHALDLWKFPVADRVFIDAGASTGGFTHCLLQKGARAVHAVDVGYNQLDYTIRKDNRVHVHERTNIMDCTGFQPEADAAVADVSFRSIVPVAGHLLRLTKAGKAVVLIKPQFEYKDHDDDFKGVVESDTALRSIVIDVVTRLLQSGIRAQDLCKSPILGRKGNVELFVLLSLPAMGEKIEYMRESVVQMVDRAIG